MRDIRFRAFDKEKNIMIYDYDQSIGDIYNLTLGSSLREWLLHIGLINETLMQFTGLHDKHNKPIYESDIVKYRDYDGYKTMLIEWQQKHYNRMYEPIGFHVPYAELEIMGNIYEHPHLLGDA
jgi:uncharacterized phage protein (TIGR01671 family)